MKLKEVSGNINIEYYPDIIKSGGLNNAINEILVKTGSKLKSADCDNGMSVSAIIRNKERSSQIMPAANERLFLVDLWNEGIRYGGWRFADLTQASYFITQFVELYLSYKEMKKVFPWFHSEKGKIHEKGAKTETRLQWNALFNQLKNEKSQMKFLLPCLKTAKRFSELKVLFPFTSHNTLCFSLTTGYPFLEAGPKITSEGENHFKITYKDEVKEINSIKEIKKYFKLNLEYYGIAGQGTAEYVKKQ